MTTAWAHLPNAALIDQLLAHAVNAVMQSNIWFSASDTAWAITHVRAGDAARDVARCVYESVRRENIQAAVWSAIQTASRKGIRAAALAASRNAPTPTDWSHSRGAIWDAAMALIAYDDCGWMLNPSTSSDVLRGLIRINQDPAATLLLAYKLFLEKQHV
jgi:hypothetical protein